MYYVYWLHSKVKFTEYKKHRVHTVNPVFVNYRCKAWYRWQNSNKTRHEIIWTKININISLIIHFILTQFNSTILLICLRCGNNTIKHKILLLLVNERSFALQLLKLEMFSNKKSFKYHVNTAKLQVILNLVRNRVVLCILGEIQGSLALKNCPKIP